MRFTIMESEQKKGDQSELTVDAARTEPEVSGIDGKKSRKNLIIAVVAIIVVLALVLTTVLVGWYLFTESERNLIKDIMQTDKNTIQETTVDVQSNVIQFDVMDADSEATIIDDYNRYVEVIKMKTEFKQICLATPLNETSEVDLSRYITDAQTSQNWTAGSDVYYVPNPASIPDVSFLSKKAQTLCNGMPIYWALPKCGGVTGAGPIQKRGLCSNVCNRVCKKYFGVKICHNVCSWLC